MAPYKSIILNDINRHRNNIAGGQVQKHRKAARMGTVTWDDELAYVASLNAMTCKFDYDQCHNTARFKFSGQTLGKTMWVDTTLSIQQLLKKQVEKWYQEHVHSNMSSINRVVPSERKQSGRFRLMAHEQSVKIGCSAVRYKEWANNRYYDTFTMTCNWAHNLILGSRVYQSGPIASLCKTGTNPYFPNLCSIAEKYNYNKALY